MPFVRLISYTCYRRDIWPEIPAGQKIFSEIGDRTYRSKISTIIFPKIGISVQLSRLVKVKDDL